MTQHIGIMDGLSYYSRALADIWQGKLALGALIGLAATCLKTDATLIMMVIGAMCTDFALGLWVALRRHRFRCHTLVRGVAKLPCYAFYTLIIQACDYSLGASIGLDLPGVEIFLAYLLLTDCVSILAHCAQIGLPVPPLLKLIVQRSKARLEQFTRRALHVEQAGDVCAAPRVKRDDEEGQ